MSAVRGAAGKEWGSSEPGGGEGGGGRRSAARARRAEGSGPVPSPEPLRSAPPPLPRPRGQPEGTPDPGPRLHPVPLGDPGSPAPRPGSSGRSPAPRPLARPPRLPPSGAGAGRPDFYPAGPPGIKATADTGLRVWVRQRRAEGGLREERTGVARGPAPLATCGRDGEPFLGAAEGSPARLRAGQIPGGPPRVRGLRPGPGSPRAPWLRAWPEDPPTSLPPRLRGAGPQLGTSANRGTCPPLTSPAGAPHVAQGRLRGRTKVGRGVDFGGPSLLGRETRERAAAERPPPPPPLGPTSARAPGMS